MPKHLGGSVCATFPAVKHHKPLPAEADVPAAFAPENDALTRIHTLAETLIVRVARGKIERAELLEALARIANDAEACMHTQDDIPF
jgi:hypothetical protein